MAVCRLWTKLTRNFLSQERVAVVALILNFFLWDLFFVDWEIPPNFFLSSPTSLFAVYSLRPVSSLCWREVRRENKDACGSVRHGLAASFVGVGHRDPLSGSLYSFHR